MTPLVRNALWGLKYATILALAFALGLGLAYLVQGSAAFATYHPSPVEMVAGTLGIWLVGGLIVGLARPVMRSPIGYLAVWILGGAVVVTAVEVMVLGLSYFSPLTTLLVGALIGWRGWAMLGRSSESAV